jgi:hypothetical protein
MPGSCPGTEPYRVITIDSWRSFVDLVAADTYKNWAFRGHAEAEWPLHSALSRYLIKHGIHPSVWIQQELRILRIFRRKAHHFLQHVPGDGDSFQWLALMQHHGAPTRLLDLTWSPYVAAFFALERATSDAAVWASNVAGIQCQTPQVLQAQGLPQDVEPGTPEHLEKILIAMKPRVVFIGEPAVMNRRLIAQSGTFAVPGAVDQPVEDILSGYPGGPSLVVKLLLKTSLIRNEAMRELYNMNLTQATLFPDLDGLARSLAYELEFHWAFDPHTGGLFPGYAWRTDKLGQPQPYYD